MLYIWVKAYAEKLNYLYITRRGLNQQNYKLKWNILLKNTLNADLYHRNKKLGLKHSKPDCSAVFYLL